MQLRTAHPDWFQTVPLIQAIDPEFDINEYFGDVEYDWNVMGRIQLSLAL